MATPEKSVTFHPVLTASLARATGLFNAATSSIDEGVVKAAVKRLTGDLAGSITIDGGFGVKVVSTTCDAMTAAEFLDRPEWLWDTDPDPLENS